MELIVPVTVRLPPVRVRQSSSRAAAVEQTADAALRLGTVPDTVTCSAAGAVQVSATDPPFAGTICTVEGVPDAGTPIHVVGFDGESTQPV